ncbi:hypothetical protein EsH8_II_000232 [Colletotrichum jinshuiense]
MTESTASLASEIADSFVSVLNAIQESKDEILHQPLRIKLVDELAQFKVWSGDVGALRTGQASLEYRLRDASHIRKQVSQLLKDLRDSLHDAVQIIAGLETPWDFEADSSAESTDDLETGTEIAQIVEDVTEVVDCLARLSVSIHSPAPHDQIMASKLAGVFVDENLDIKLVNEKFEKINGRLAIRLGRAVSRRREYFRYREANHHNTTYSLKLQGDADEPETEPFIIPSHKNYGEEFIASDNEFTESSGSEGEVWHDPSMKPAKVMGKSNVPALPKEAASGPFQCPYCYTVVSIKNAISWR